MLMWTLFKSKIFREPTDTWVIEHGITTGEEIFFQFYGSGFRKIRPIEEHLDQENGITTFRFANPESGSITASVERDLEWPPTYGHVETE